MPPRLSFRRRLLRTVVPALIGALGLLAVIAWGAVYTTHQRNAVDVLRSEVHEVETAVELRGDSLITGGPTWQEPHHRLAVDRVDPIFIQVFDTRNRLVRASANIPALTAASPDGAPYPPRLLAARTSYGSIPSLRTFSAAGRTFYYLVAPLHANGTVVGTVQVARPLPDSDALLTPFGLALGAVWILLSVGLSALIAWAARRVLAPLRAITDTARSVTSSDLNVRVNIPDDADRETALLARTLNDLLDRIESHVEALRTFTANAAHELQTPLTVLRGHVEIALRRDRSADSYRDTLHLLNTRLGDLVRTVRALLTLTRLDRGETMDRERVDLARIAREETAAFADRADAKGLAFHLHADTPAWVKGQPDLLREAVRNLVDNALKYTPEGAVHVGVETDDDAVRLVCRDTGIGIDPDDLPRITDRFFRSPAASQIDGDGSGLGLSIVRRIVHRHDGRLDAAATNDGTRFMITLPVLENQVPVESEPQTADPEARTARL